MGTLGFLLIVIGAITTLVGGIRFLIAAFEESMWWGLGVLFFQIATPFFLIMHFWQAWPPTRTALIGFGFMVAGVFLQAQAGTT